MVKLSVITTFYNCEKYLKESLDSLFAQDFQDFEVIFVNDGSEDGTRDILLQYLDRSDVRLLENLYNEGIFVSRNRALFEAKGEYVAIVDGDDINFPSRFSKEVEFLDQHPDIGFIGGHALKINSSGSFIGFMTYPPKTTTQGFSQIRRYKLNPIIDPSCMYRRQIVMDNGGYSMKLKHANDFELWCRLLQNNVQMSNIQEPLIKYRVHEKGNTKKSHDEMRLETDLIQTQFLRRTLPRIKFQRKYFEQEHFVEYMGEKHESG